MKKIALLFLIAFTVFACTKKSPVTITGKITNPLNETVVIQNDFLDQKDTITLGEDGTFSVEINLDKAYMGYLWNGNLRMALYMIPGTTINLDFNADDFENGSPSDTIFSGDGSAPSALLLSLQDKGLRLSVLLMKMSVDSFVMQVDSVKTLIDKTVNMFSAENKFSEEFTDVLTLIEKIKIAGYYKNYMNYHPRFAPTDTTSIPESFQEYVDGIPLDQVDKYIGITDYKSFLTMHYQGQIQEELKADTTLKRASVDYFSKNIDLILASEAPVRVKDVMGRSLVSSYSYMPDSIQQLIKSRYKEMLTDPENIKEFEGVVATIEKTKPGTVAPSFNYIDINGDMVSSESLLGKVVYIDVWATWCGPCRGEIPSLKKMEEELDDRPIAFVSISIDDDKEAWEKMVKEDELGGLQLFAEGAWQSDITKAYAIRGIPRFIMIDKEGKIVNANASRPSNPQTKEKLLELAEM
ncbi:TlpA disulfide reductase family protein [Maribellus sediminis]|uniref:TlpA disulfide reductase family protein n=1 Tax=Maribellus sediminis TaxID=2696285 RepID=UPI00142F5DD7|nr:TlpA disulfide reductase family protein [Maribellus sediminis]